jgi:hypothetical protein
VCRSSPRSGVVVVAARIEHLRGERLVPDRRVHEVLLVVARVPGVLPRALVRRARGDGAERVQELVRHDCSRRDAAARLEVDDRDAEAGRVASTLAADVLVRARAVVVRDDLRERRPEARLLDRVRERREAPGERSELCTGTRGTHDGHVELCPAREGRHVVPRRPRRVLPAPPAVDLLRVRLHDARHGSELVLAVGREEVHPVHGVPRDRVRCAIGLGCRATPCRRSGDARRCIGPR